MLKYIGDFERLKEFGFVDNFYSTNKFYTKKFNGEVGMICIADSRKIYYKIYHSSFLEDELLIILFDLIQAGLVEKVVEE